MLKCPKCSGNLFVEGEIFNCLQCGYEKDMTHFRNSRPYPFGSNLNAEVVWHRGATNLYRKVESLNDMNILS
jgi:DNA-directed RNA polymerase subunit M/transcription elongation factor TFIIS